MYSSTRKVSILGYIVSVDSSYTEHHDTKGYGCAGLSSHEVYIDEIRTIRKHTDQFYALSSENRDT